MKRMRRWESRSQRNYRQVKPPPTCGKQPRSTSIEPLTLTLQTGETLINCRCYAYGEHNSELCYAIIAGPEQLCVSVFSNLVQKTGMVSINGHIVYPSDHRYTRSVNRVAPYSTRWVTMMIQSKDPNVMYQTDDDALLASIKRCTETPVLPQWMKYIRHHLTVMELMTKLVGHNESGSYLSCDSATLDKIVSEGVAGRHITIGE